MKKQEELFDKSTRVLKNMSRKKSSFVTKPFFKNMLISNNLYSNSVLNEDFLRNPSFLKGFEFQLLPQESVIDSFDDSFDGFKNLLTLNNYANVSLDISNTSPVLNLTYNQVMDYFRGDFDDSGLNSDSSQLSDLTDLNLLEDLSVRVFNPVKLRSTTRNSAVTFSSIQKVFKSRFDEGRSNARLQDVSNSYVTYPFLTEPRSSYESFLSKNNEGFFNVNFYDYKLRNIDNSLFSL
jgi:hypothetical protein